MQTAELSLQEQKKRQSRNTVWLLVLVALIIALMFSSYFLFNQYWDPAASESTFSH